MENQRRSRFDTFLLPEQELNLKLIFDNVRNYGICAFLIAGSLWFKKGTPGVPASDRGTEYDLLIFIGDWSLLITAITLTFLNFAQTMELMKAQWSRSFDEFTDRLAKTGERKSRLLNWVLVAYWILGMLVSFAILAGGLGVIAICLFIYGWYGSRLV